jgi:hypothetical protein
MGVNVTPPRGSKVVEAEHLRSAGDAACAEGPALMIGGIRYQCRGFVPGLPALTARARVVNGRQHRVRGRADQRAVLWLLRRFVKLVVVDPSALPRAWWKDPGLLAEAQTAATRLLFEYDDEGRAVA